MDQDDIEKLQRQAREILEKRNYERFKTKIQVRFRKLTETEVAIMVSSQDFTPTTSEKGRAQTTKQLFKVFSEDVSKGGLRIQSPEPLPKGVILAVELHLPEIPLPITALAEVVWVAGDTPDTHACGLSFTSINKADLLRLERFLLLQR